MATQGMKVKGSQRYPDSVWGQGYTGKGITIAVLDSGVDDEHPSFNGSYVAGVDFSIGLGVEGNPSDRDGHGTHVAGIVLGRGGGPEDPDRNYTGIAPEAYLVDVKVLTALGVGYNPFIAEGIQWCIDHRNDDWDDENPDNDGIDIISISIGGGNGSSGQSNLSRLIDTAGEHGIVVVTSAGNEGPDNEGFDDIAAADGAITVGAVDDMNTVDRLNDRVTSYSNRGPRDDDGDDDPYDELKPDVVAPGENIISAEGTLILPPEDYVEKSGTSMACPMVSGIAALMLEANPGLTPGEMKHILHETSDARGEPYNESLSTKYNSSYGWGIVDGYQAVKAAANPVDLEGSNTRVTPSLPKEGEELTVTCTVTNTGELDSTGSVLIFYYHGQMKIARSSSLDLSAGESRVYSYDWPAPEQTGYARYSVEARSLTVNDSDPEDNLQEAISYVLSRPEFSVKEFFASEEKVSAGNIITVHVSIDNTGEVEEVCSAKLYFYNTHAMNGVSERTVRVPGLGFAEVDIILAMPEDPEENPVTVHLVLESHYILEERNTGDNAASLEITVQVKDTGEESDDDIYVCGGMCGALVVVFLVWIIVVFKSDTRTERSPGRDENAPDYEDEEIPDDEIPYEEIPGEEDDDDLFDRFFELVGSLRERLGFEAKKELEKGEFLGLYVKASKDQASPGEKKRFVRVVDTQLSEKLDQTTLRELRESEEFGVYKKAVKRYKDDETP